MRGDGGGVDVSGLLVYQGSHEDPPVSGRHLLLKYVVSYLMKK